jgi:tRNA (guanine10-N2)-dimethyltransferase
MNLYAFELGRKKELCFAELITVMGEENLVERGTDLAIFKFNLENPQTLQNQLGGTIKIIKILDQLPLQISSKDLKQAIQKHLKTHFQNHKGKVNFSISTYNFKKHNSINIKDLLNFSKKILKSLGLNSRFVNKGQNNPPSSTIYKAKVLKKGIDLNIIKGKNTIFLGKTVAIQNIDNYSKRDFHKPCRDARIGMMPPKLAQIMINLVGPSSTIYDPFCGTGTILTEGLLMELDVLGSDIDKRMVKFSEKNCHWLEQEFRTKNLYKIFEKDAQEIKKEDLIISAKNKIDCIITEGYLGPLLTSPPSESQQNEIFSEISTLHENWLKAVHSATDLNCKIVMCKTAFRIKDQIIHFPDFQKIAEEAGWKITKTFTYDRPDQIVIRDIAILEKS